MRVASVQVAVQDRPKSESIAHVLSLLDNVAGCDLVLLPEMWTCGYFSFDHYADDAETIAGPTIVALAEKARDLKLWLLAGSFPERDGDSLFNTTVLIDPQGVVAGRYRKTHLFGYQSDEPKVLQPGSGAVVIETSLGRIGFAICYDLRFPELFRDMIDQGAEIFLVPAAWPASRVESWTLFNRSRAAENLAYLISCNAAGTNRGQVFGGNSLVVGPYGQVLASAGADEEILVVDLDIETVRKAREEFPALRDRITKRSSRHR